MASDEKRKGKLETRRQKLERNKKKTSTFDPETSKPQVEKRYLGPPASYFSVHTLTAPVFFEHSAGYRSHQFAYVRASGIISWLR